MVLEAAEAVGVADHIGGKTWPWWWGEDARGMEETAQRVVAVLKRC
jgi:hypothetical protein